ncbi:hypothetical protein HU200_046662 [Digitaria exilis]|uniref:Uncharacterized protein n=1 Tax=Digitaria exilis TaxID=1010633 RepID=A0A835B3Y8_9POAL|nr:hypothetical protein HU200_046662 [Digitaria exilis]CAB3445407.1 unnamed protein product [Digitaria exilis]
MAFYDPQKTSWPEVLGWPVYPAMQRIRQDRPELWIEVHRAGESVPPGVNNRRVRVFVNLDAGHTVAQTPVVG